MVHLQDFTNVPQKGRAIISAAAKPAASKADYSRPRQTIAEQARICDAFILLAPTGALILMMVRDISVAPAFSDFHSVHWCN